MGEFKSSEFNINLDDERLDNAQYILMSLLEKFKLDLSDTENLTQANKILLNKITNERYGISIGHMSTMYGEFEFYINGIPKIYTPTGTLIVNSSELKSYLLGILDIESLHFESLAYIYVLNQTHPENYYGVFYSLRDAIKIASENDLVKAEGITS